MGEVVDTRWKLASGGNSGGIGGLDWCKEERGIRLGGWVLYKGGREKLELSGVSVVLSS